MCVCVCIHIYMVVMVNGEVAQSCPTLCDPVDCSLQGSSIHGILQARILEWVAISFSSGPSQPRDQTQVSCIAGRCFTPKFGVLTTTIFLMLYKPCVCVLFIFIFITRCLKLVFLEAGYETVIWCGRFMEGVLCRKD